MTNTIEHNVRQALASVSSVCRLTGLSTRGSGSRLVSDFCNITVFTPYPKCHPLVMTNMIEHNVRQVLASVSSVVIALRGVLIQDHLDHGASKE